MKDFDLAVGLYSPKRIRKNQPILDTVISHPCPKVSNDIRKDEICQKRRFPRFSIQVPPAQETNEMPKS